MFLSWKNIEAEAFLKWLMKCVMKQPALSKTKSWMLKTADAHGLYEKFGFKVASNPEKIMEKKTETKGTNKKAISSNCETCLENN